MLLPKSSCVCISCFNFVTPKVCSAKVPFLAYFRPDMNTEMGRFQIYMGSWSSSLGSSNFAELPFSTFLALYRERKRCGQVGSSPCYSQSEVVYA